MFAIDICTQTQYVIYHTPTYLHTFIPHTMVVLTDLLPPPPRRWLYIHGHPLVHHRSVLEVGAGNGLVGLLAGMFASRVTISDFNQEVVHNIQINIQLNSGGVCLLGLPPSIANTCTVEVRRLVKCVKCVVSMQSIVSSHRPFTCSC